MANLTPTPVWDQVPQLEEATIARAGPGGPMNTQAQALANRTEFLAQNALRFVRVRASSLTFYFPASGGTTPGSITLTALVNGDLTGTPVFTVIAGTAVLVGTGDTRTLAAGDMLTDSVTITVSVGVYSDTITITKVRDGLQGAPGSAGPAGAPGSPGANASILALFPTALAFTYDKNGEPSPASQTITFNAQLANLAGTATFVCTLYDVSGTNIGAVGLGGSGNSRTLTIAQFGAAKYAVVEASLSGFSDRVTIIRLRDGENAVTGLLTNESVTLAASADGVVPSFAAAGGTFKVFDGTTDVTLVSGFSVVAETGADVSIVNNTGVYSVASMSADTATAILRAVYGTVTIDKVLTLAKSRAGAQGPAGVGSPGPQGDPGLNAQLLTLLSSSQSFRFDRNNAALPTAQTITFTAQLANLGGVATFVCTLYDGAGTSLGTVAMGGAGSNVRTLTAAQFGSAQYAVVTATLSGLSDQMTVVRVRDGSNALSGLLTNESVTLAANSSGGVADFGPAGGTFRVFDGSNDVTTSSSFTVVTSSGATAAIGPSTGIYSVSAMPADTANVTLRATYNGVTIDKVLSLSKSRAGAQGEAGSPGAPGAPGGPGIRGSRSFYLAGYSSWNSAAATSAASVDGGPVLTDVVTQYSAGFAQTRFWNGSAWLEIAEVINGNLLVNGTVAAQAFVAGLMQSDNVLTRGLTVRDASGNIILGSGSALPLSYAAPGTVNADLNPAIEYAAANAQWNNVSGRPADDSIRNNLIDLSFWKRDGVLPWPTNGEYNRLVVGPSGDVAQPGPRGGSDVMWYTEEITGNGEAGGGWEAAPFATPLDPNKTYRLVVPVRRINGSGSYYWGGYGLCPLNTTTVESNPYFVVGSSGTLQTDRWYLFVGYVFPYGSTGNNDDAAGIYDCKTGLRIVPGNNWNHASYGLQTHRAYQFYASLNANCLFGRPMCNVVDGTEPSLREYFESSAVLNDALVPSINQAATTANWNSVNSRPPNLVELSGSESIRNALITIAGGVLSGIGTPGVQVDNSYTAIGQNLIPNSDQARQLTWTTGINFSGGVYWNPILTFADAVWGYDDYALRSGTTRNIILHQGNNTGGGSDQPLVDVYPFGGFGAQFGVPVVPGKRYCFSYYVQTHRCKVGAGIYFYDGAGNWTGIGVETPSIDPIHESSFANRLERYTRVTVFAVAPSNAATVSVFMRKYNTRDGQTDSYWWAAAPQLEVLNDNAVEPSPYMPGPIIDVRQGGYTGDLNATNGAQTGVNLRDDSGVLLSESQLKNSAISITLNPNGTISVGGGPSASGAITLGGLGAGAFALLNQITSANISTYIAGAAIDLARINLATINNLAALSSLLGAVEIVAGGHLRSGQTGYATGNGFWLGWDGGEPALSIGGAAAYLRYKPSLGMQLKLDTFSASITGGNISVTNSSNLSPQGLGTRGISVSGGQAPYSYSWSISFNDPPIACTVYISGGSNLSSATVVGDLASTAGGAFGQLQCSVTDSNGRVAFAAVSLAFTGSSYSP